MSIADSKVQQDRFSTLEAGMNSNLVYSLLPKNQASLLVNATVRQGLAQTRPGFRPDALSFPDEDTQTAFETGNYQGGGFYQGQGDTGISCLIVSIKGRIYRITTDSFVVSDITPKTSVGVDDPNSAWVDYVYFRQAEQYMIIQDNQSAAIIFDGAGTRRADPTKKEVPRGTAMAYGMGRLWVANGLREFIAGDIVGGATGILCFTENTYLAGGGSFSVPLSAGNITAMEFVANLDTSLGQGALMIFTQHGVFSVQVPTDRTQWQNTTYPVMTVAQINYGSVAHIVTPVNGDLFYRSSDGIRSLVVGIRYFGTWGNVPVSVEMSNPLDFDDPVRIQYASSMLFDNRLLMTSTPQKTERGTVFKGMIALDFNLVSSLRGRQPPAYDGLWTGLSVLQLIKGVKGSNDQGFAFVVNSDNKIALWEITKEDKFDDDDVPIKWSISSPGLNFKDPMELKQLFYGDIWIDKIAGNVEFQVNYRPDYYPFWVPWVTFSKCSTAKDCTTANCPTFQEVQEQYRPRIRLPQPTQTCDPTTGKPLPNFYQMQTMLEITGHCRLIQMRVWAKELEEDAVGACPGTEACSILTGCNYDPYSYSSES